jgi:sugar phosphate isomerase/epimerase
MQWILSAFPDEAGASCREQIAALQRADLTHIDLRGIDGFNIAELPLDKARAIKELLDDAALTVNMFGTPLGKIDISDDFETDRRKLAHLSDLAPIFDCFALRIFSYYNKENRPEAEFQSEALRRLNILKEDARRYGLILFHENEKGIFGDTGERNIVLADELRDDKIFKMIFDFDNYNQVGDDVWQNWERLRHATDAFHLKDSTKENQHVPIGQGNGHAREILSDAQSSGWVGSLSVEPHLSHSSAVMATHVSGEENQEYGKLPLPESFHAAVTIAQKLIEEVGAKWA